PLSLAPQPQRARQRFRRGAGLYGHVQQSMKRCVGASKRLALLRAEPMVLDTQQAFRKNF
ncbi:MAG: hypothetical protein RR800_11950, partial [Comamonas sp.]